jgi:putative hemolysin
MKTFARVLILVFTLAGCSSTSAGQTGVQDGAAAAYCTQKGGKVETRYPFYAVSSANPVRLAGSMQVCTFTADDDTRIMIALDTLYTDQPTLAAAAYLAQPRMTEASPSANPSSLYCSQLGGTDLFGGVNASAGGWANEDASDGIAFCIFPDLSAIDSWGLTYHSDDVIRGADLTGLLRYQPEQPAGLFR